MLAQIATVTAPSADSTPCAVAPSEIVVCGRRSDLARYRLPAPPATEPAGAEWKLGGGVRPGIAVSQGPTIQGVPSNRVMATVGRPF